MGVAHGAHTLVRRDGAHGHSHGGQAAPSASGYAAPASPSAGYSAAAPASGYEAAAPAQGYDAPSSGYGAADAASYDYGTSSYGAEEEPFNISTLIIPLLIIAGLSLLFPTITTVSVRKKRHAEGKIQHKIHLDLIQLDTFLYSSSLQYVFGHFRL